MKKDKSYKDLQKRTDTDFTIQKRKEWVMEEIVSLKKSKDIWNDYQKEWGMSKDTYFNDVAAAYKMIRSIMPDKDQVVIDHIGKYYALYETCKEAGDASNALKALKAIETLYQLHNQDRTVNKTTYKQTIQVKTPDMTVEQIKELLGRKDDDDIDDRAFLINKAHGYKGINIKKSSEPTDIGYKDADEYEPDF